MEGSEMIAEMALCSKTNQLRSQLHHFGSSCGQMAAAAFDYGLQVFDRLLESIVDDNVVEFVPMAQILGRVPQAPLNHIVGVRAAPLETQLQRLA